MKKTLLGMEFLAKHYQWVFGGIGVPLIIFLIRRFWTTHSLKTDSPAHENNQVNTVTINNNIGEVFNRLKPHVSEREDAAKSQTRILFIDDKHTDFKMVSILKKSGWVNTKSVKDITDLDDPKVLESEIIFVDINGVGATLFQDQGLGLASALKKKYPVKNIVLYSAETTGDRFHKALREVDDCLYKDAEPYQFINLIEGFSKGK